MKPIHTNYMQLVSANKLESTNWKFFNSILKLKHVDLSATQKKNPQHHVKDVRNYEESMPSAK